MNDFLSLSNVVQITFPDGSDVQYIKTQEDDIIWRKPKKIDVYVQTPETQPVYTKTIRRPYGLNLRISDLKLESIGQWVITDTNPKLHDINPIEKDMSLTVIYGEHPNYTIKYYDNSEVNVVYRTIYDDGSGQ